VNITFPVTIGYNSLEFFENFYKYYNYIFGELELNVKISQAVLMRCCVDTKYSLTNGVDTSMLAIMLNIRSTGSIVVTYILATLLKRCVDNIIIPKDTCKSIHWEGR
jgi:hypothetical protein